MAKSDKPARAKQCDEAADAVSSALKKLKRARKARLRADEAEQAAVDAARAAGASWTAIGELYGLTKQGAQQRFNAASKAKKG